MAIEHVSDTARWVAVYRAMESERPDAIFRDPFARQLAGARGEEIVNTLRRGRSSAWAMIVRTAVFDEVITRLVTTEGVDVVINLAAGLDARPWRLALPSTLRWIDVDFHDILEYKRGIIGQAAPACRYEAVAADLTDAGVRRDLFARLGAESKRALVVAEGLLVYLTPEHAAALAADLHAPPGFRWWLFDLASPRLLVYMNRAWGKAVRAGNAPFQFGPAEGSAFFERFGWRTLEFHSTLDAAQRLRREMPGSWLWRLVARFSSRRTREQWRRFSGYVLLGRGESESNS